MFFPCTQLHVCDFVCLVSKLSPWSYGTNLTDERERGSKESEDESKEGRAEQRVGEKREREAGDRRWHDKTGGVKESKAVGRRRDETDKGSGVR